MFTVRELKAQLKSYTREALVNEIATIYRQFPAVEDYLTSNFAPELDRQVLEKYKKLVKREFFPERGYGNARISVARKAVTDYAKVSRSNEGIADVMLYLRRDGSPLY